MKSLVTGATGFLGGHLVKTLRNAGHEVIALGSKDADLTQPDSLMPWTEEKIDLIFHLAAWTQAGDFCLHHPGEQWLINQMINTNILAFWAAHHRSAKLIGMGTSCCYQPGTPHTEDRYLLGEPTESLFTYAMTKRMLYVGMLALHRQFDMSYLCFVPSTLYGPGYPIHPDRQLHFIFDLIRKIVTFKFTGVAPILWGDGSQVRELIFVDDFVKQMVMLTTECENDIINVGGGIGYPIRYFAELICGVLDVDPAAIQYDTSKYVGAKEKVLDTSKVERMLPDFTRTDLGEGIHRTVEWYLSEVHQHPTSKLAANLEKTSES